MKLHSLDHFETFDNISEIFSSSVQRLLTWGAFELQTLWFPLKRAAGTLGKIPLRRPCLALDLEEAEGGVWPRTEQRISGSVQHQAMMHLQVPMGCWETGSYSLLFVP